MVTTLMKRVRTPMIAVGLLLLIAVLLPIWGVHMLVSWARTARRRPSPTIIERVDIATTDLDTIIAARHPVIISGLTDVLGLDLVPDVAGLRSLAEQHDDTFTVTSHLDHSPYFLYRGDYGAEVDRVHTMQLDDFVDFMFDAPQQPGTCTYRLFNVRDLGGRVGDVIDDISDRLAVRTSAVPDRSASGLWIGSTGVVTPLHHDAWTGLLFQFHGTKRVTMFSPTDRPNLYFSSPFAPRDVWSKLPGRSSTADLDEFPRLERATRHEAHLEAGDVLFIPPFWAHEIEALEANISIPFRFATSPRDYVDPGFLMPAYEIFDQKFRSGRRQ